MATGIFYPVVGADDGHTLSTASWSNSATYGYIGRTGDTYRAYIRFPNVTIPHGALITSAFVRLTCAQNQSGATVNLNIYFNNSDDAVAPLSTAQVDSLDLTTALVAWDGVSAWVDGTAYDTPSIIAPLQEVVKRSGFASGNAVMVAINDDGSNSSAFRLFSSVDYDSGSEKAELHVEWIIPVDSVASWSNIDAGSYLSFSTDLLTARRSSDVGHSAVRSNWSKTAGKWYWEVIVSSGDSHYVGVGTVDAALDKKVGGDDYGWAYCDDGQIYHDDNTVAFGATYTAGDVIGVAMDVDAGKVWFSKNGVWQGGGNPEAGTGEAFSGFTGTLFAMWSAYYEV